MWIFIHTHTHTHTYGDILSIHKLMDIWALIIIWLLLIILLMHASLWICIFASFVVQLLSSRVVLFLTFWGNPILFSILAATIYIPINRAQMFPFLNTISCLFDNSSSNRCEVTSHCHLTCISWWLIMLSNFSCACWLSGHLLWKNVYSDLLIL